MNAKQPRPLRLMLAIFVAASLGCGAAPRSWKRPDYQPGGGTPLIYYVVYGSLPSTGRIDGDRYRMAESKAFAAHLYNPNNHPEGCARLPCEDPAEAARRCRRRRQDESWSVSSAVDSSERGGGVLRMPVALAGFLAAPLLSAASGRRLR